MGFCRVPSFLIKPGLGFLLASNYVRSHVYMVYSWIVGNIRYAYVDASNPGVHLIALGVFISRLTDEDLRNV
jgi:hypothetical protein